MPRRLGSNSIDYAGLARQLRDVHRRRAARLDGELPAKEADCGLLSLDRALDVLQGDDAHALLDEVGQHLRRAVREIEHTPAPEFSVGAFPVPLRDRFLDGVLDYYRGGWDTSMDQRRLAQAVVTALANAAGDDGFVAWPSKAACTSASSSRTPTSPTASARRRNR